MIHSTSYSVYILKVSTINNSNEFWKNEYALLRKFYKRVNNHKTMIKVDANKCPQNHPCPIIRVCPKKAISQKGYGLPVIDNSKCTNCGLCTRYCPTSAISKV
jgi:Fe-S-cluster-containing hydrogenase component 2